MAADMDIRILENGGELARCISGNPASKRINSVVLLRLLCLRAEARVRSGGSRPQVRRFSWLR